MSCELAAPDVLCGMNQQPLVSVCIANYNGMAVIDDCLRSVLEQEGNIAVEILVHDDASSDGSVPYIRDHYPAARLIVSENNVGFCVANNRMAAAAKGKYLLLLNNDAALYPDALQTLLAEADRLEAPAILSLPQYDAASGELIDRGCLLDPFFNPVPNLNPARQDVAMVIGACLWIPKDLWDELEGFPEWFGSIAEDMYLCCRARLAGYAVRALAVSGYRHWQGKSFGGNRVVEKRLATTFRRRALSERNKSFVMVLTYPALLLQLILPFHLALLMLEGAALALLKRDARLVSGIYLPCLKALWRKRRQLLSLRREVQASRRIGLAAFLTVFTWMPRKLGMLIRHGLPKIT
jgi:GT2 family glycosyltransferase